MASLTTFRGGNIEPNIKQDGEIYSRNSRSCRYCCEGSENRLTIIERLVLRETCTQTEDYMDDQIKNLDRNKESKSACLFDGEYSHIQQKNNNKNKSYTQYNRFLSKEKMVDYELPSDTSQNIPKSYSNKD